MTGIAQFFETTMDVIQSLTNSRSQPMHVGEVMTAWTYLAFVESIVAFEEVGLNMTMEADLKKLFTASRKVAIEHREHLTELLRKEGVPLPEAPEGKPECNPEAIPAGVKFTDNELVNMLNMNFVVAAGMCANAASQSLRADVSTMFLKFQMDKLSLSYQAKELMERKGWLKIPPFYNPPGSPRQ
ncbi:MAG: hypothetical protein K0R75_3255 [Paenibacillaceae bacterium]|jgi:hypothetical protein|nr:hypothetical protein [Paenibacillaceae bacterium]